MTLYKINWGLLNLSILATTVIALVLGGCVDADRASNQEIAKLVGENITNAQFSQTASLVSYNNQALFTSGNIEITSMKYNRSGKSLWGHPDNVQLWLKVCGLSDRASSGNIIAHKFEIASELGKHFPVIVSDGSCLEWTETFDYNYFAPSVHLVAHFQISSKTGALGQVVKRLAFNPWDTNRNDSQYKGAIDITNIAFKDWPIGQAATGETNVLAALKGELNDKSVASAQLFTRDMKVMPKVYEGITAIEKQDILDSLQSAQDRKDYEEVQKFLRSRDGTHFEFGMQLMPMVRVQDSTGMPHDIPIKQGRFKIYMQLMATGLDGSGKSYILNQLAPPSTYTWTAGENGLLANMPVVLKWESRNGNLALAVKVVAVDLPSTIAPLSVVYDLGPADSLMGSKTPQIKTNDFKVYDQNAYDSYIQAAENYGQMKAGLDDSEVLKEIATIRKSQLFVFEELRIRFVRILPGETATDRTFMYAVTSCVKDGLTGRQVGPGLQFDVTTEDGGKFFTLRRETDETGCLTWFGYLSHKYYQKEVLFPKNANVKFVGVHRKNLNFPPGLSEDGKVEQTMAVNRLADERWQQLVNKYEHDFLYYMNPWDEKMTFGWDARNTPENYLKAIEEQKELAPTSRMFISDFRYETMGFRYEIDKYMNLKVKKTVLLKTFPYVLKYNSIVRGRSGTESLRDGVYLMKVALQKDYLDPSAKGVTLWTDGNGVTSVDKNGFSNPISSEDRKSYISVQEILVRVIGGMIVTPIEFEMSDLRLMRIRNQFFIQLQTIDENRLRLATLVNDRLAELMNETGPETFTEILDVAKSEEEVGQQIANYVEKNQLATTYEELQKIDDSFLQSLLQVRQSKIDQLKAITGWDREGLDSVVSPEKQAARLERFLTELKAYRDAGVNGQTAYRNSRRKIIDELVGRLGQYASEEAKKAASSMFYYNRKTNSNLDPSQLYFYTRMTEEPREVLQALFHDEPSKLEKMIYEDFTVSPLTPNFSFELLRNDFEDREDYSGLPGRTFVGPLTFLYNGNGGALRPTDILNEGTCLTSTCAVPDMIHRGLAPSYAVERANAEDKPDIKGDVVEVYQSGDMINKRYEGDKFYGYLADYYGMTVDKLIAQKAVLDEQYHRTHEAASQIYNYLEHLNLRYVPLREGPTTELKWVDYDCVRGLDSEGQKLAEMPPLDSCFKPVVKNTEVKLSTDLFWGQLNDWDTSQSGFTVGTEDYATYFSSNERVTENDLRQLMVEGPESLQIPTKKMQHIYYRLCHVLTQNMMTQDYKDLPLTFWEHLPVPFGRRAKVGPIQTHQSMVASKAYSMCAKWIRNMYVKHPEHMEGIDTKVYPPVVIERKLRVYDTTKRYFYRGGKSLNINVSANFTMNHNKGYRDSVSASGKFDPLGLAKDSAALLPGGKAAAVAGGKGNGGGFFGFSMGITKSYQRDEGVTESDGTTVNSQTFLVSQQATLDIEIGEYERCMVVRLNPLFIVKFLEQHGNFLKKSFDPQQHLRHGVMICTGEQERECEPIKEKYYYFTQHFTEGDMLDPASLHNHPWLLQVRGYRDFQTFVSSIGGRKNAFLDTNSMHALYKAIKSDLGDLMSNKSRGARGDKLQLANQEDDIIFPLRELGRVYFNVLPTFPGMYTYVEPRTVRGEDGREVDPGEFPDLDTDPAKDFNLPEECPVTQGEK